MKGEKYLIIDADDFGITLDVSQAIIETIQKGVVTSTNVLATTEQVSASLKYAKEQGLKKMGIHLNLDIGESLYYKRPIEYIQTFKKRSEYIQMVENEFFEQIEYVINNGIMLTHITSHKGILSDESLIESLIQLAKQYDVPVRRLKNQQLNKRLKQSQVKMVDQQWINGADQPYSKKVIKKMFEKGRRGQISEMICHPGRVSEELKKLTSMTFQRENERKLFTKPSIRDMIKEAGYTLVSYDILGEDYDDE